MERDLLAPCSGGRVTPERERELVANLRDRGGAVTSELTRNALKGSGEGNPGNSRKEQKEKSACHDPVSKIREVSGPFSRAGSQNVKWLVEPLCKTLVVGRAAGATCG